MKILFVQGLILFWLSPFVWLGYCNHCSLSCFLWSNNFEHCSSTNCLWCFNS